MTGEKSHGVLGHTINMCVYEYLPSSRHKGGYKLFSYMSEGYALWHLKSSNLRCLLLSPSLWLYYYYKRIYFLLHNFSYKHTTAFISVPQWLYGVCPIKMSFYFCCGQVSRIECLLFGKREW